MASRATVDEEIMLLNQSFEIDFYENMVQHLDRLEQSFDRFDRNMDQKFNIIMKMLNKLQAQMGIADVNSMEEVNSVYSPSSSELIYGSIEKGDLVAASPDNCCDEYEMTTNEMAAEKELAFHKFRESQEMTNSVEDFVAEEMQIPVSMEKRENVSDQLHEKTVDAWSTPALDCFISEIQIPVPEDEHENSTIGAPLVLVKIPRSISIEKTGVHTYKQFALLIIYDQGDLSNDLVPLVDLCSQYYDFRNFQLFNYDPGGNGYHLNQETFLSLLNCYCRSRKFDMAAYLLDKMIKSGCSVDIMVCKSLIKWFLEAGMLSEEYSNLNTVKSKGHYPDLVPPSVLIHCLSKVRSHDAHTHAIIMDVLENNGNLAKQTPELLPYLKPSFLSLLHIILGKDYYSMLSRYLKLYKIFNPGRSALIIKGDAIKTFPNEVTRQTRVSLPVQFIQSIGCLDIYHCKHISFICL